MTAVAAISLAPSHRGKAIIDAHSPLHAIVGFAAGIMGIDPHLATLTFIGARIMEAALEDGTKEALFERERGKSLGNEMANVVFEVLGLYCGEKLRARLVSEEQQLTPPPTAGLGHLRPQFSPMTLTPNGAYR